MGSCFFATGRFQLPNWNSQIPPVCKKFFIQWKEQGVAGVVGRGRVVALDHKDVWKTWFWGLGCLMGIKEWRLEDANRWCGVAVPRLPDASLCSCHISTGLKARGYSFSRLPDGFSLTAHHNDSEPLLVPVLGEILKRVQDDDWRIRSSLTAHCSSLIAHRSQLTAQSPISRIRWGACPHFSIRNRTKRISTPIQR